MMCGALRGDDGDALPQDVVCDDNMSTDSVPPSHFNVTLEAQSEVIPLERGTETECGAESKESDGDEEVVPNEVDLEEDIDDDANWDDDDDGDAQWDDDDELVYDGQMQIRIGDPDDEEDWKETLDRALEKRRRAKSKLESFWKCGKCQFLLSLCLCFLFIWGVMEMK